HPEPELVPSEAGLEASHARSPPRDTRSAMKLQRRALCTNSEGPTSVGARQRTTSKRQSRGIDFPKGHSLCCFLPRSVDFCTGKYGIFPAQRKAVLRRAVGCMNTSCTRSQARPSFIIFYRCPLVRQRRFS